MKKIIIVTFALSLLAVISYLIIQYTDFFGIKCENVNTKTYIADEKFAELNDILDKCFEKFNKDKNQESNLLSLLRTFGIYNPDFEIKYSKWVHISPDSYQPYLARGIYFSYLGYKSRGEKTSSETSENQFTGMRSYFKKARQNIVKAMGLKNDLFHAYHFLINMANTDGADDKFRLAKIALDMNPSSLMIRWDHMNSLLPRWGGSAKEMKLFVEESQPYFKSNPKLEILRGRLLADMGNRAFRAYRYKQALELYNKSLQWGDYPSYNFERGALYARLGQYKKSLDDLNKAIKHRPYYPRAFYERCYTYTMLEKYEKALKDCSRGIEISNKSADSYTSRGTYYSRVKKYQKALADLDKAIKINPGLIEAYRQRGYVSMSIGDYYSAIDDFNKVLPKLPNDSRVFSYRGFSYKRIENYEKALADYRRAVELDPNNKRYKKNVNYTKEKLRRRGY